MSVLAIDTGTTGAAALIVTADGTVAGREGWRIQPVFPALWPFCPAAIGDSRSAGPEFPDPAS
jgi:sugar (pentulose or hexulose) kinase